MPAETFEAGRLLGAIFSGSPDAVIVVDDAGRIVLSSPAVFETFGYYPEELVGEPIEILVPEQLHDAHRHHRTGFMKTPAARHMGAALDLSGRDRDGRDFPIDVSLAPVSLNGRTFVAAFVRDATERRRAMARLRAIHEITSSLLEGASVEATLTDVASRARELVEGEAAWIATPSRGGHLVVRTGSGQEAAKILGLELSDTTSRSALVMQSGKSEVLDDLTTALNVPEEIVALDLGPAIYAPLVSANRRVGTLVVARARDGQRFDDTDTAVIEIFAASAAVAFALGGTRDELERLRILAEEERIARDLHDGVIQQLFAVGLSLQGVQQMASGVVADRVTAAVDVLDDVIREIRDTIFGVTRHLATLNLADKLQELVAETESTLGFAPRLRLVESVDVQLPEALTGHLIAVLREAFSNVARHAEATRVDVVVTVSPEGVLLSVADDGVGLPQGPSAGNGLHNMAERASLLGGSMSTETRNPSGTVVNWKVPLPL